MKVTAEVLREIQLFQKLDELLHGFSTRVEQRLGKTRKDNCDALVPLMIAEYQRRHGKKIGAISFDVIRDIEQNYYSVRVPRRPL